MRVNKIIETNEYYEQRLRVEPKPKRENSNKKEISFLEILKKNICKDRV
ncbi:hypothetical protein [Haloimpatiens massiliensis]|nr:hypothetical protein [Haloimpatiens massiliensis]